MSLSRRLLTNKKKPSSFNTGFQSCNNRNQHGSLPSLYTPSTCTRCKLSAFLSHFPLMSLHSSHSGPLGARPAGCGAIGGRWPDLIDPISDIGSDLIRMRIFDHMYCTVTPLYALSQAYLRLARRQTSNKRRTCAPCMLYHPFNDGTGWTDNIQLDFDNFSSPIWQLDPAPSTPTSIEEDPAALEPLKYAR
jgi:hypothetical protein